MASSSKNVTEADMLPWKNMVLQKVDAKITLLKHRVTLQKSSPVLTQPDVIQHLEELHKKYVFVPIDKAANNVAIVCKKHYVEVILKEVGVNTTPSATYSLAQKSKEEIIFDNIEYSKRLKLQPNEERDSVLPVMY